MLKAIKSFFLPETPERLLKSYQRRVTQINALESEIEKLSDDALRAKTADFKQQIAAGKSLDDLLPETFATVREAAKRVIGQRHYDVQLIGGMALHDRMIAEMRTGEGKTLVSTLAAYLNALDGKGVHVVTVNDYLAGRDRQLMGPIHEFLGLSVGLVVPGISDTERKAAYDADITYVTNSELGFDHLKDNLKLDRGSMVQRGFHFAILDEIDSILIDEARTPLVISDQSEDTSAWSQAIDRIVARIPKNECEVDEKEKTVNLSDAGIERAEAMLQRAGIMPSGHLYDPSNATINHYVNASLRAHRMFQRDRHYIVRNGEIVIIDEGTGRAMEGRRFNEGIHQAIEAKERVKILAESQTVASVTYQALFRSYTKLAGMTGTAKTEADEFAQVYGLGVISIPTHKPIARRDEQDEIYRTKSEKITAIIAEIEAAHDRHQPVLVGTSSIEGSEEIAQALMKKGFKRIDFADAKDRDALYTAAATGEQAKRFSVLNARDHENEARIIAQAGVPGAITIATNMAGRGTDIKLGGDPEMDFDDSVKADTAARTLSLARKASDAGGLYVIGTERHESRRIDNQLRGRSGRQGDPGRSKFFLSLEDDLLRVFGNFQSLVDQMDLKPREAIAHPMMSRAVEQAQKRRESHNFDIRKQVLKFDNVIENQRQALLAERKKIMDADDVRDIIDRMRTDWLEVLVDRCAPARSYPEQWDLETLASGLDRILDLQPPLQEWIDEEGFDSKDLFERLHDLTSSVYAERAAANGDDHVSQVEKKYLLWVLDACWRDHLTQLDHLKQSIGLRALGQRDPINEFQVEAAEAFDRMITQWEELVTLEVNRVRTTPATEAA